MARFDHWNGYAELEEKALSEQEDHWKLTGYAATFHDTDRVNDAIVPGAFQKCLERMSRQGETLQLYFNHKLEECPLGPIVDVREDRKGLKYIAHLSKEDVFVRDRIVPQIKSRALKSNSFGYKVRQSERRKSDNVRLLKEIDIFEISVVGMPANPAANIENIKGVVPFGDLPIADPCAWDAEAAMKRVEEKFAAGEIGDMRRAFLYFDEEADKPSGKFLIADIDDKGCLVANRTALFKAVASLQGSRKADELPEGADEAIKGNLERYYQRLDLESPFKSFSKSEFDSLEWGEREARLRHLGLSRGLAKDIVEGLKRATTGQRDADRTHEMPETALTEEAKALLNALSAINAAVRRR